MAFIGPEALKMGVDSGTPGILSPASAAGRAISVIAAPGGVRTTAPHTPVRQALAGLHVQRPRQPHQVRNTVVRRLPIHMVDVTPTRRPPERQAHQPANTDIPLRPPQHHPRPRSVAAILQHTNVWVLNQHTPRHAVPDPTLIRCLVWGKARHCLPSLHEASLQPIWPPETLNF